MSGYYDDETLYKYAFKISAVDEEDHGSEFTEYGVLYARDNHEALQKLENFYGEENLTAIELIPLNEDFIFFTNEETYKAFVENKEPFKAYI